MTPTTDITLQAVRRTPGPASTVLQANSSSSNFSPTTTSATASASNMAAAGSPVKANVLVANQPLGQNTVTCKVRYNLQGRQQ